MPNLPVNNNTSGDTTLIASPGARLFIRIKGLDLTASDAVTVSLKSGSTVIWSTTAMENTGQAGGIVLNTNSVRDMDTVPGQDLVMNLSAGVRVRGSIDYAVFGEVPTN